MPDHITKISLTEEMIRVRSYLIWEREGYPDGRDKLHWDMARRELEAEMLEASMIGENPDLVLPLLPISHPPRLCLPKAVPVPRRTHTIRSGPVPRPGKAHHPNLPHT